MKILLEIDIDRLGVPPDRAFATVIAHLTGDLVGEEGDRETMITVRSVILKLYLRDDGR